jgi:hypothetical protein
MWLRQTVPALGRCEQRPFGALRPPDRRQRTVGLGRRLPPFRHQPAPSGYAVLRAGTRRKAPYPPCQGRGWWRAVAAREVQPLHCCTTLATESVEVSRLRSWAFQAKRYRRSYGRVSTHCRYGTCGRMAPVMCSASSTILFRFGSRLRLRQALVRLLRYLGPTRYARLDLGVRLGLCVRLGLRLRSRLRLRLGLGLRFPAPAPAPAPVPATALQQPDG